MNEPPSPEVAVFAAALELPAEERGAYLDQACAGDTALRRQVEALLRVHDDAGNFFDRLASAAQPASAKEAMPGSSNATNRPPGVPSERPGDRIGRYKLLQQIGEGGCGVVYMAEQEEPVRRRVALKVIKLGMDTKNVIARFEAERQALALMDHPNIAKVLEAGATETGRPYFVMELVRGIKITDYCDQNSLSTRERLDLFIQVCRAIQHAHQKGVIHRDIKPSNILVTMNDGVPVPKVIDFGIAKATSGKLTNQTLFTAFEQFIGTPAYMSPEQAELSALDVDTRSDIYSLGVLLYELLTGQTPFDAKKLLQAGLDEIRRTIRQQEPSRPSTCLSTMLGADLTEIARHRKAEPPRLIHLVRGDLDWIVMKSLEKDRSRRYETANGLAADIQRHLNNEPVVACPPGNLYKFQKLVRRNKLTFIAAGVVAAGLIIGLGIATWSFFKEQQARQQAEAEREIAKTEAAKATAISVFLEQALRSANPDQLKGSDYTVRQLLDDFSSGLENQFQSQPEVEAEVRVTLGRAYYRLGFPDKSQPQMERALILRRRIFGEREQVAATLVDYAWTSFEQDRYGKGESQAREALAIYRKCGTEGEPVVSALWVLEKSVAALGRDRDTEVEAITQEALTMAGKSPGIEFPETANILHGLAEVKNRQGKYDEGATLASNAVAMHRRLQGVNHPETAWALISLGVALRGQGKLDESVAASREALRIFRKSYPWGHKSVVAAAVELKLALEAKGDTAAEEALEREILAGQRATLGSDSTAVAETLMDLAQNLQAQGKNAESAKASQEALDIILKSIDRDPSGLPPVLQQVSQSLNVLGKPVEAGQLFQDAIHAGRLKLGETNLVLGELFRDYGEFLSHEGKWDPAVSNYLDALSIRRARQDETLALTLCGLGDALNQIGREREGEEYLRESLALYRKLHPEGDIDATGWTTEKLGYALWQQHRLLEAEQAYRDALKIYTKLGAAGGGEYPAVVQSLGDVLMAENKPAAVEALYHEVIPAERAALGNDNSAVAETLRRVAELLRFQGKSVEAEQAYRDALTIYTKIGAAGSDEYTGTLGSLFNMLEEENKLAEGEALCRQILAQPGTFFTKASHTLDPVVGMTLMELADLLQEQNKSDEAASRYREALNVVSNSSVEGKQAELLNGLAWNLVTKEKPLNWDAAFAIEVARKAVEASSRKAPGILDTLSAAYAMAGQFTNAVQIEKEAIVLLTNDTDKPYYFANLKLFEANKPYRDDNRLASRAVELLAAGRFVEAEPLAREALELRETAIPDDWRTFNARSILGGSLLGQKKFAEAEPLLASGYEGLKQRADKIPPAGMARPQEALQRLVQLYEDTARPDQAIRWKSELSAWTNKVNSQP